jgi:mRNA interferase MazF
LPVEPSERNGLREPSNLMVDTVAIVAKSMIGRRIGKVGR